MKMKISEKLKQSAFKFKKGCKEFIKTVKKEVPVLMKTSIIIIDRAVSPNSELRKNLQVLKSKICSKLEILNKNQPQLLDAPKIKEISPNVSGYVQLVDQLNHLTVRDEDEKNCQKEIQATKPSIFEFPAINPTDQCDGLFKIPSPISNHQEDTNNSEVVTQEETLLDYSIEVEDYNDESVTINSRLSTPIHEETVVENIDKTNAQIDLENELNEFLDSYEVYVAKLLNDRPISSIHDGEPEIYNINSDSDNSFYDESSRESVDPQNTLSDVNSSILSNDPSTCSSTFYADFVKQCEKLSQNVDNQNETNSVEHPTSSSDQDRQPVLLTSSLSPLSSTNQKDLIIFSSDEESSSNSSDVESSSDLSYKYNRSTPGYLTTESSASSYVWEENRHRKVISKSICDSSSSSSTDMSSTSSQEAYYKLNDTKKRKYKWYSVNPSYSKYRRSSTSENSSQSSNEGEYRCNSDSLSDNSRRSNAMNYNNYGRMLSEHRYRRSKDSSQSSDESESRFNSDSRSNYSMSSNHAYYKNDDTTSYECSYERNYSNTPSDRTYRSDYSQDVFQSNSFNTLTYNELADNQQEQEQEAEFSPIESDSSYEYPEDNENNNEERNKISLNFIKENPYNPKIHIDIFNSSSASIDEYGRHHFHYYDYTHKIYSPKSSPSKFIDNENDSSSSSSSEDLINFDSSFSDYQYKSRSISSTYSQKTVPIDESLRSAGYDEVDQSIEDEDDLVIITQEMIDEVGARIIGEITDNRNHSTMSLFNTNEELNSSLSITETHEEKANYMTSKFFDDENNEEKHDIPQEVLPIKVKDNYNNEAPKGKIRWNMNFENYLQTIESSLKSKPTSTISGQQAVRSAERIPNSTLNLIQKCDDALVMVDNDGQIGQMLNSNNENNRNNRASDNFNGPYQTGIFTHKGNTGQHYHYLSEEFY